MLLLRSHPILTRKGIGIKRGLRGIFGSGERGDNAVKKEKEYFRISLSRSIKLFKAPSQLNRQILNLGLKLERE